MSGIILSFVGAPVSVITDTGALSGAPFVTTPFGG